jgi:hypothetical protein
MLGNSTGHVTHLASSSDRFSLSDGVISPVSTEMSIGRMENFCMLQDAVGTGVGALNKNSVLILSVALQEIEAMGQKPNIIISIAREKLEKLTRRRCWGKFRRFCWWP